MTTTTTTTQSSPGALRAAERLYPLAEHGHARQIAARVIEEETGVRELLWVCRDIRDFLRRSGYDTRLVDGAIALAEGRT